MQWAEIRRPYPEQWLLLEALDAHTEGNQRILEQLAVLDAFDDSQSAMKRYAQLHHVAPARELYVFHTRRETLDVTERRWYGVRAAR